MFHDSPFALDATKVSGPFRKLDYRLAVGGFRFEFAFFFLKEFTVKNLVKRPVRCSPASGKWRKSKSRLIGRIYLSAGSLSGNPKLLYSRQLVGIVVAVAVKVITLFIISHRA